MGWEVDFPQHQGLPKDANSTHERAMYSLLQGRQLHSYLYVLVVCPELHGVRHEVCWVHWWAGGFTAHRDLHCDQVHEVISRVGVGCDKHRAGEHSNNHASGVKQAS